MARKGDFYYYVSNAKPKRTWTSLGSHYGTALAQWARLEGKDVPADARTFIQVSTLYRKDELPKKAPRTRKDNGAELKRLEAVFGDSPLETIRPTDVRRYLDDRCDEDGKPAPVRANREVALLSHVINFARARGMVEMANPCSGIRKNKETGRERYVEDAEFDAVYEKADEVLRDALDLLLYTGQRPSDVIAMKRQSLRNGDLWVRQAKTGNKIRIIIEGELAAALERMQNRKRAATGPNLVQDDNGQPLTYWMLEGRFAKARAAAAVDLPSVADIQLRDVRGKTATDALSLEHAQKLLGHSSRAMTEHYTKKRLGDTVSPLQRKTKRDDL